eukprot:TRINITY_DN94_c1_g1_i1.p1 TRINITY_DN94_c1_g1~~TRINITY_DN94_c1_g1_i1.p1  ORF type:complete len:1622 (+),score=551.24 TRINITY_DN94_c1_g1_i1:481-4866(+)
MLQQDGFIPSKCSTNEILFETDSPSISSQSIDGGINIIASPSNSQSRIKCYHEVVVEGTTTTTVVTDDMLLEDKCEFELTTNDVTMMYSRAWQLGMATSAIAKREFSLMQAPKPFLSERDLSVGKEVTCSGDSKYDTTMMVNNTEVTSPHSFLEVGYWEVTCFNEGVGVLQSELATTSLAVEQLSSPSFIPKPNYSSRIVEIESNIDDVEIIYTLDGSKPIYGDLASSVYVLPITFYTLDMTLNAIVVKDGFIPSEAKSAHGSELFIALDDPIIEIKEVLGGKSISVTLDSPLPDCAIIRLSTNYDSTKMAIEDIPIYSSPIVLTLPESFNIASVIECGSARFPSNIIKKTTALETCGINIDINELSEGKQVNITSPANNASIYFTIDGSAVTQIPDLLFENPFDFLERGNILVNAISIANGCTLSTTSQDISILEVETPTLEIGSDKTEGLITVKVATMTDGAMIECYCGDKLSLGDIQPSPATFDWGSFLRSGTVHCLATKMGSVPSQEVEEEIVASICGDGTLNLGEECDDGNLTSKDGCSSSCTVEENYTCNRIGSSVDVCKPDDCEDCDGYDVSVGVWGQCSMECGPGIQTRDVQCIQRQTGIVVAPSDCDPPMEVFRPCMLASCEVETSWKVGTWGLCSAECQGEQTRSVICVKSTGEIADDTECSKDESKPLISQPCGSSAPCPPSFLIQTIVSCSEKCGGGEPIIESKCVDAITGEELSMEECSSSSDSSSSSSLSDLEIPKCQSAACVPSLWSPSEWIVESVTNDSIPHVNTNIIQSDVYNSPNSGKSVRSISCVSSTTFRSETPSIKTGECEELETFANEEFFRVESTVLHCSGRGTLIDDKCECNGDFTGDYCTSHAKVCPTGILDSWSQCCSSGLLNANGKCCDSSNDGSLPILDKYGECCTSGKLDSCGICDGNGVVDSIGKCCSSGIIDAGGLCCESGNVDECGVCDGLGQSCGVWFSAIVTDKSITKSWIPNLTSLLHISSLSSNAKLSLEQYSSEDNSVGDDYSLTVDSVIRSSTIRSITLKTALETLKPSTEFTIVDSRAELEGICGNGICELSERCNGEGACCPSDCPVEELDCPQYEGESPCGAIEGHGYCVAGVGKCGCFTNKGFGGESCNECLAGWWPTYDNERLTCVRLPLPSVFDGITNGYETGVDCGGLNNDACIEDEPSTGGGGAITIAFALLGIVAIGGITLTSYKQYQKHQRKRIMKDNGVRKLQLMPSNGPTTTSNPQSSNPKNKKKSKPRKIAPVTLQVPLMSQQQLPVTNPTLLSQNSKLGSSPAFSPLSKTSPNTLPSNHLPPLKDNGLLSPASTTISNVFKPRGEGLRPLNPISNNAKVTPSPSQNPSSSNISSSLLSQSSLSPIQQQQPTKRSLDPIPSSSLSNPASNPSSNPFNGSRNNTIPSSRNLPTAWNPSSNPSLNPNLSTNNSIRHINYNNSSQNPNGGNPF